MKRVLALALFLFAGLAVTHAQTGLPLWGSFESGALDTVNRQNLNVNFTISLVSAPSRGEGFNYSLVYNSLIWTRTGNAWTRIVDGSGNATWGWNDNQPLGSIRSDHFTERCNAPLPEFSTHYQDFSYQDVNGTVHKFSIDFYTVATTCQFNTGPRIGFALDGSGYKLDATSPTAPIVRSPRGDNITGIRTDTNGNYVSGIVVSSTETDFKDTNGRVTLKAIKSSNTLRQYQILDQTGLYSNVIANATYAPFNIKTHFACAGVTEYTANGLYLITQLALPSGQSYSFTYEDTPTVTGFKTGRIKTVTLPTGGFYEYDYPTTGNNGINCTDGTVTSLTRIVNDGSANTWQFTRSGTGFSTTTEKAPKLPYDSVENNMVFTFSGTQVTSQKIYQGAVAGTLLRTINTSYAANGTPSVTTTILEDNSTKTKVETDIDSNANLTEKREFAWGTGAPGALIRRTTMTYLTGTAYTTANILNRVTQVLVKDGGGAVKARTDITYDAYGSSMTCITGALQHNDASYGCSYTIRGNPTSIVRYSDAAIPSGGVTTNLFYDSLGNVAKTDVNGMVQSQMAFTATTQYAFPDSVIRGPSPGPQLTTSATYNANTGLVATSIDENTQVTNYTYDSLRRLTDVQRPDNAHVTLAYDDVNKKVTLTSPVQGTDVVRRITYLDTLGRVKKTAFADISNTTYSIAETQFDPLGRAYKVSNPHNSTAQYWTEIDTDALGRVTKQILPDGNQTTLSYSGHTVTITDPAGHQSKQDVDALGRLATAYEPDVTNGNSLTLTTAYTYDVLDGLTQVSQGVQTRIYTHDSLERVTSVTLPETGQVQYQYNAFNQRTTRTDARGVITTYSYDTLNRSYQVIYNVGATGVPATATVTYTFGTTPAQFNNGRLITLATSGVETDSFTYDQLGRITNVSKNITGAKIYNIGYGHNLAGQVSSTTYPSTRVVTQTYDAIGRLSQISDGTPRTYANQFSYNPAQELLGYTAGNTVQAIFGYSDPRLQIGTVSYKKGTNTLFSVSYGYTQPNSGNNGQVTAITDNITAANSLNFTYDALGRLTRGTMANLTVPNSWDISWTYDRYANRTNQTLNGGTLAVTNQNLTFNTNNQPTGGFAYDGSGNMTDDAVTHNYVYDAENRFVKLGTTVANTYDGSSLRIKKVTGGSTTVYVFSGTKVIAEYTPSAATSAPSKEYVYSGSELLATLDASHNPTYRQSDLLSARLVTDANGNVIGTQGHLPFGESWYSTGTVDKWKFTSYERDSDTSLDYAMMRFDSARLGRFMSPDPYGGSAGPADPQRWNRYAYVMNDPLNAVDPFGLEGGDPPHRNPCWNSIADIVRCGLGGGGGNGGGGSGSGQGHGGGGGASPGTPEKPKKTRDDVARCAAANAMSLQDILGKEGTLADIFLSNDASQVTQLFLGPGRTEAALQAVVDNPANYSLVDNAAAVVAQVPSTQIVKVSAEVEGTGGVVLTRSVELTVGEKVGATWVGKFASKLAVFWAVGKGAFDVGAYGSAMYECASQPEFNPFE